MDQAEVIQQVRDGQRVPIIPPRVTCRPIGVLLFDGYSFMAVGLIVEVFTHANELAVLSGAAKTPYELRFLSTGENSVVRSSSFAKVTTDRLDPLSLGTLHGLFFVGDDRGDAGPHDQQLIAWARLIYSRSATYSHSDDHFGVVCAALLQVKRDLGVEIAKEIAVSVAPAMLKKLIPQLTQETRKTVAERVLMAARWMLENCNQPITVVDAAQVAAMSQRTFLRQFKREMGSTPSDFLMQVRLHLTCLLLAETSLPVDRVARRSGMRNGNHLAKMFRKRLMLSPSEFRESGHTGDPA